ncbi:MAG TPA: glycosyltransferase [Ignavibacteria bacterium]|nr:glycosyltransferase [Ignavibacteria bacterium]
MLKSDDIHKPFGISFISSFVPRQCGIATFTNDLATSINTNSEYHINITALNDIPEGYKYSPDVKFEIKDKSVNDFKEAAYYLNLSESDVINIQHEFGLYGGDAGSNILHLVERLNKPSVATLHTVLENPSKEELKIIKELSEHTSFLVVMSQRAVEMLNEIYGIPMEKIKYIPHGAHDVPFLDTAYYKDKFRLSEKKVILTFGLLGPGKGLEDVINSLPVVIKKYPDIMYIVLGATHPNVKRQFGESYRNSLENLVKKNELENNVMFINRFVSTKELLEFLLMSDIYVSPYHHKEQIVSGTLTYALASGKAVISTPYWYAEEALSEGRGILVPPKNPEAIGKALSDLLLNENKRNRFRKKAYDWGRQMIWSNVGKMYSQTFYEAIEEFKSRSIPYIRLAKTKTLPSLPDVNLNHLKNLTDDTGIIQHASYSIPNPNEGYCTDDNARALLTAVLYKMIYNDESIDSYINKYLMFVSYSFNKETGLFRNFMSYDRKWLEETGSEDCNGRVIYTLGYLIKNLSSQSILGLVNSLFEQSIKNMVNFKSPRAISYVIIGCVFYLNKFSGASEIKNICNVLIDRLHKCYTDTRTDDWQWFENKLTYVNSRLSQALLMGGHYKNDKKMIADALESLEWLYDQLYDKEKNCLSLVGNEGWYVKGGTKAKYDQQPVEIPGIIDACFLAFLITKDNKWINRLSVAFTWFLGNNDRQETLCDFATGACYDGLTINMVNQNQGAESTLSWLQSLLRMNRISQELQID